MGNNIGVRRIIESNLCLDKLTAIAGVILDAFQSKHQLMFWWNHKSNEVRRALSQNEA